MSEKPEATGPRSENPYCVRCSQHLGISFHETNEHDAARERAELHERFSEIVDEGTAS